MHLWHTTNLNSYLFCIVKMEFNAMKITLLSIALTLFSFQLVAVASQTNSQPESLAISHAKTWLQVIDAGNYSESWEKAAPFFQSQLSQANWDAALTKARSPLGAVVSRIKLSSKAYSSLPGVDDGEYLIIQFQTDFKNKKNVTETLTLSKTEDTWLPIGYFIR